MVECKSAQQVVAREVPGLVELKSAQGAAAGDVPGLVEHKLAHLFEIQPHCHGKKQGK
jgi:hypothetical protein